MSYKVAVCGAAGGIGQPLSLLLKCCELVGDLRLYDLAPFTPGVAVDLSHINTPSTCTGFTRTEEGGDKLLDALKDADVVVIPAGVPRKPGMTRDDLFNINAGIVKTLIEGCAEVCPKAMILIISNPVNSTVPVAVEVLKAKGCYDPKRVMGVTTLDITRAKTFIAGNKGIAPKDVKINVIGGHAGKTIIPVLSQTGHTFSDEDRDALTHRIMFGGDEVVQAKAGAGSATLSMAYAGASFAIQLMKAMNGEKGIVECCYSENSILEGCPYFAVPCSLGPGGIEEHHSYGTLNAFEQGLLDAAVPELNDSINKGVKFMNP
jgi:malate dehydrogenase